MSRRSVVGSLAHLRRAWHMVDAELCRAATKTSDAARRDHWERVIMPAMHRARRLEDAFVERVVSGE